MALAPLTAGIANLLLTMQTLLGQIMMIQWIAAKTLATALLASKAATPPSASISAPTLPRPRHSPPPPRRNFQRAVLPPHLICWMILLHAAVLAIVNIDSIEALMNTPAYGAHLQAPGHRGIAPLTSNATSNATAGKSSGTNFHSHEGQLFVLVAGRSWTMPFQPGLIGADVQGHVSHRTGIPTKALALTFQGKSVPADAPLTRLGVGPDCTLRVVGGLKGGAPGAAPTGSSRASPSSLVFSVGMQLQYYSENHEDWLRCTISSICPSDGAVEIDIKPFYWLTPEEHYKLRPLPETASVTGMHGSPVIPHDEAERTPSLPSTGRKRPLTEVSNDGPHADDSGRPDNGEALLQPTPSVLSMPDASASLGDGESDAAARVPSRTQASPASYTPTQQPPILQSPDVRSLTHGFQFHDATDQVCEDPVEAWFHDLPHTGDTRMDFYDAIVAADCFEKFKTELEVYNTVYEELKRLAADERTHRDLACDPNFSLRFSCPMPFYHAIRTTALAQGWTPEALAACIMCNIGFLENAGTRLNKNRGGLSPSIAEHSGADRRVIKRTQNLPTDIHTQLVESRPIPFGRDLWE